MCSHGVLGVSQKIRVSHRFPLICLLENPVKAIDVIANSTVLFGVSFPLAGGSLTHLRVAEHGRRV